MDNGEDFDYQNQEVLTESHCGTDFYNTFFKRNREIKSYKKKKKTDHTPRYLQRTSTQQQSYNPNWRIAKQECTRRPKSKQGKNPLIDMETQQNMPFAIVLTTGHKIVLTRRIKTHSL